VGHRGAASLAPRRATVKGRHLGVGGGLVDEDDPRRIEVDFNLGMAVLVSIIHSAAMIAAGGPCALSVYRYLGLKFVKRSWYNLDATWAVTLVSVGTISLVFCILGAD
jgi:hypothetical protein